MPCELRTLPLSISLCKAGTRTVHDFRGSGLPAPFETNASVLAFKKQNAPLIMGQELIWTPISDVSNQQR